MIEDYAADTGEAFHVETSRLVLRDWRAADWARFFRHTNTPAVMRWLGGVLDAEKETAVRDRLLSYRADHGFTFWAVTRKGDGGHMAGELLGFCGLKRSNLEPGPIGEMEIGWRLREDAWGHGYAAEAARKSLALAFERFGAPHVIALTVLENTASRRLMERLGMTRRATRDFRAEGDAAWAENIIVYDITREDWAAQ
ncbi:GNAT family N-acetyltransferase [uncultured Croceicoccus sp.]|uniref:GNAT family N-acetyltransferase n=1 Tax=uncultured Croceicoccus sp. TaxID=1295329 RepID=UPI00263408BB|nr:GNAT family N-acetyltransferase [uncultured Croceicoccus sp.]